jgi:hypothetical protein
MPVPRAGLEAPVLVSRQPSTERALNSLTRNITVHNLLVEVSSGMGERDSIVGVCLALGDLQFSITIPFLGRISIFFFIHALLVK